MERKLQGVENAAMRHLMGNVNLTKGGAAIGTGSAADVKTTANATIVIKGIMYTYTAAEVDISAAAGLPDDDLADGYTQVFGLEVNAAGTAKVVYGEQVLTADITSGDKEVSWPSASDEDHTVFAAVKVVNASGADFIFGTTLLSAAGITDTYYDVMSSSY